MKMTDLVGKYMIDCTIRGENVFVITKVNKITGVYVEPTEKFKNTQSSKIFDYDLFKDLLKRNRVLVNSN